MSDLVPLQMLAIGLIFVWSAWCAQALALAARQWQLTAQGGSFIRVMGAALLGVSSPGLARVIF